MTELTRAQAVKMLPGEMARYRPMSYRLPDPCEACWLERGRIVPPGLVVTYSSGDPHRVCVHGDTR